MFIDIHTHLTDRRLQNKVEEIVKICLQSGVGIIVDTGHNPDSSKLALRHATVFDKVYCTLGIHPERPQNFNEEFVEFMLKNAAHPKCLAVGEIGLDYHYDGYNKKLQNEVFVRQIELADRLRLPIVVHSRDASNDMLAVLTENKRYLNNGFLMHCYSESFETAKKYLDLGGYFSFGGVITFKNSHKSDVINKIPTDRVLAETDAPYLTPEPYRGGVNYPYYVRYVYNKLAEIYNLELELIINRLQANALTLFKKIKSKG